MAEWKKWTKDSNDGIQSGDIVETVTKIPPHSPIFPGLKIAFIKHYGMVVTINGKLNIIHNIIGRKPTIAPFEEVFKDRKIHRVLRTGLTDSEILKRFDECKDIEYQLFSWNCEDLMCCLSGISIGYPQRNGWTIGLVTLGILIVIILFLRRKK